jgi:hypothetical protein
MGNAAHVREAAKDKGWTVLPVGVHRADICPRHDPKDPATLAAVRNWTGW